MMLVLSVLLLVGSLVGAGYLIYRAVRFIGISSTLESDAVRRSVRKRMLGAGLLVLLESGYCYGPRLLFASPEVVELRAADLQSSPALGCWSFRTSHGSSRYVPNGWHVRLDTVFENPKLWGNTRLRLSLDSVELAEMPESQRVIIGMWMPYADGGQVYLHWGNGFTGLSMKLGVRGDQMAGWSITTTDFGGPGWGPRVLAARVKCDSVTWVATKL